MNYWENKEARAKKAREHTVKMTNMYSTLNDLSIKHTLSFDENSFTENLNGEKVPEVFVTKEDTVSAVLRHHYGHTTVLNFASYKNPGGMFYNGSSAQEESLCHESNLYNVLSAFEDSYYAKNRKALNKALYLDRALYSPYILFERPGLQPVLTSVITCAAPNYKAAARYQNVTPTENSKVLESRVQFIKNIVETEQPTTLILGAYGCGVFGQNPREVAELFKEYFGTSSSVEKIVYAIPGGVNYEMFRKVFGIK